MGPCRKLPNPTARDVWRVNGVRDLKPPQVAILQELVEYREERAIRINQPDLQSDRRQDPCRHR